MKIGLYLFLYGSTSSDATSNQAKPELQAQAFTDLVVSVGKISNFIFDDLRSKPQTRSGVSKVELIKDHLDKKVLNVQGRIKHALMLCGPGVETPADGGNAIDDLSQTGISRGGSFGGGLELPPGFGPRPQAMPIAGDRMPPGGQTYADNLDFIGGTSIGSEHGFVFGGGSDTFGGFADRRQTLDLNPFGPMPDYGGMPQGFDPLGAYNFGTSYRRRRSAQSELRNKIKKMNKTFVPLENFIRNNLNNCKKPRIERLEAKVDKMKARVKKVVKRQGMHTSNRT